MKGVIGLPIEHNFVKTILFLTPPFALLYLHYQIWKKRLHTSLSTEIFKEDDLVHITQGLFSPNFRLRRSIIFLFIYFDNYLPSQISIPYQYHYRSLKCETSHYKKDNYQLQCVATCVSHRQKWREGKFENKQPGKIKGWG